MLPYPVENSLSKAPLQKASARNRGSPSAAGRSANFAIPATQRSPARATTVFLTQDLKHSEMSAKMPLLAPEETEK